MNIWESIQTSVQTVLAPPDGASSRTVRLYGLAAWGVGFAVIVVVSLAIFPLMRIAPRRSVLFVTAGIGFIGYALMIVGCYRVLTGKRSDIGTQATDVSLTRIVVGLFSAVLSLAIPPALAVLILAAMSRFGLDARLFLGL